MFFCFFCVYVSSLYVLWVASIVDLRVFWQPGSVLFVLNCRDYSLFESNKFLLLVLVTVSLALLVRLVKRSSHLKRQAVMQLDVLNR